ncbi:hypothetical protein EYZ11_003067 [Aspergillus tanneri]|uniref:Uncharacterized protein n=1 Tax=Aspergillus tanneri TaxID=1220188 RepID=A0A4S3JR89_9EURO|nr:hypothetical protein EYZ11_003067 [Aspergillus tanneri]
MVDCVFLGFIIQASSQLQRALPGALYHCATQLAINDIPRAKLKLSR